MKKFKESLFKQFDNDFIGDAFYFPQIIWAAFLLSTVSVGYIFYSFSSTVINLQNTYIKIFYLTCLESIESTWT